MPLRRLLPLLVLALVVQGCAMSGGVFGARSWAEGGELVHGTASTTKVDDRSGRVRDVEFEPQDAVGGSGVAAVPGQPNKLDIPWTAGACDKETNIGIDGAGNGLTVSVGIKRDESKPCDAIGLLRTIRITLDQPLAPGLVAVRQ
jgi:hypothetical protein